MPCLRDSPQFVLMWSGWSHRRYYRPTIAQASFATLSAGTGTDAYVPPISVWMKLDTFQWAPPIGYVPSIVGANYTFSLYEWIDQSNFNIFETRSGARIYGADHHRWYSSPIMMYCYRREWLTCGASKAKLQAMVFRLIWLSIMEYLHPKFYLWRGGRLEESLVRTCNQSRSGWYRRAKGNAYWPSWQYTQWRAFTTRAIWSAIERNLRAQNHSIWMDWRWYSQYI